MEKYYFFDSNSAIGDRRLYSAADWSKVLSKFLENGIYIEGDNLTVTAAGDAMAVNIGTGVAFIDGHMYENDTPLTLNVDAAEASLDRIDLVVLRLDITEQNRYIKAFVVKGEAAAAPVAPVPADTTFIKEIPLAEIRVTAGKSIVDQTQVTDRRPADFVDPFMDGTRITYLETVLANLLQNDVGAYNKTESDNKYQTKTGAADGYVPYSGASKSVDLNGKEISNMFGAEWQRVGNDWYTRLDTLADYGRMMTRKTSDKSPITDFLKWTREGILSFPAQPHISLSTNNDITASSGVSTQVFFDQPPDVNNLMLEYVSVTGEFTPKQSGWYLFHMYALAKSLMDTLYCYITADGGTYLGIPMARSNQLGNMTRIFPVTAGVKYKFLLQQTRTDGAAVIIDFVTAGLVRIK
ncbi:hypothetical protein [Mesobacillus jeotgali]|uniref:hypothetical protein n=1 Tax=Mesobacillus jeotgali TaxID=129985 RepID=UPI001CFDB4DB|nr:hypothetical protein [Mesobacillus jeotgali]